MENAKIIDINIDNISQYPPRCFLNPKNEGYQVKQKWLEDRFKEGMKVKQIYHKDEKNAIGFIEYTHGENAWRAVDAEDHLFIHCIWISPKKLKNQGYGSLLIQDCIKDAEKQGKSGVAALTSEGPFMAGKDLFEKNGFKIVDTTKPSYNLMVKTINKGPTPKIRDWEKQLEKYDGLNIIYTDQCPWVSRSIKELDEIAKKNKIKIRYSKVNDPKDAQNAPSVYASFNLVYNKKLLVDHYISARRFENIINKEIK